MIRFIPVQTTDPGYRFVEDLLHESFPDDERRDDEMQRYNTDHNPLFTSYLITDEDVKIGLITLWKLNGFCYVEHLATSPDVRNKGYGKSIIETLLNDFHPSIIVLEVELPENELSRRRIRFYERNGFSLCRKSYLQPPYRKSSMSIPMYIMYSGTESIDNMFDEIKSEIYDKVYLV